MELGDHSQPRHAAGRLGGNARTLTTSGNRAWKELSLRTGSFGPELKAGVSLSEPIEDKHTQRMIGGVRFSDDDQYVFFSPEKQRLWDSIVKAYEPDHVSFVSAADDFRKIVVRIQGQQLGYQYQIVDFTTHKTRPIGEIYAGIQRALEVRRIDYAAADGLQIPAYLTLPSANPVHLPLVVMPHGGPASADTRLFDWWAQALADQGYAVLQPNFRGSITSQRMIEAGYGEFGRKMQSDLSDGVRHLVAEGIVDPARVCIVGASYGGYAALAGVSLDAGVYRCAVSVAGISDVRSMLRWIDDKHASQNNREQRYWDRFLGVSNRKDPRLDEISPIRHIDSIKVPVLLIHGKDDTVVPFDQSDDMADALRKAGKEVQFVTLKDEDHWLSRGNTRLQMLQATVAFLKKYNPPAP